jgi:coproporphyrinogen III oxidase-like Fe-S oxidoreductase
MMMTHADAQRGLSTSGILPELSELRRLMDRPQRHRLLHGYPLAAAMPRVAGKSRSAQDLLNYDPSHGLLVGVLPHPFCNPAVPGCGFCTFPHEMFNARGAAVVIDRVVRELEGKLRAAPDLAGRPVSGLYFGGGTANLSPPEPFRKLCRALATAFDLSSAEVTLEGVPAAFLNRKPLLVDILREELPARHFRLSMGIQTFDEDRLRRMGRLGFGTAETFGEVVRLGHARGFTVSGDLLFNLPGQPLSAMRDDVGRAIEIGLDHVGLYHLVIFPGLGTEWSRDPALVASLPPNEVAARNWLDLRSFLLGRGFYQATLTNFERAEFRGAERRFVYEELRFQPDRFDMLGLGPSGISYARSGPTALKVINPDGASAYLAAVELGGPTWDRAFHYAPADLRIFYLTRRLAALRIDRRGYRAFFETDPIDDFPRELEVLTRERLVRVSGGAIKPTESGMFYADSIAGLLTRRRLHDAPNRRSPDAHGVLDSVETNDNSHGHM